MGARIFSHKTDMVIARQSVIFPPCERSKSRYCVGNQNLQQKQFHITTKTWRKLKTNVKHKILDAAQTVYAYVYKERLEKT